MSKQIGFLIVNKRTGFLTEGKGNAAKIFDNRSTARRACRVNRPEEPVPISYDSLVNSLLKGSAFCFDSEDGHRKFISALRNDPGNKGLLVYSQDREFIKWRHETKISNDTAVDNGAGAKAVSKAEPSMEMPAFNPAILVR